jgi:hypothetical protein
VERSSWLQTVGTYYIIIKHRPVTQYINTNIKIWKQSDIPATVKKPAVNMTDKKFAFHLENENDKIIPLPTKSSRHLDVISVICRLHNIHFI